MCRGKTAFIIIHRNPAVVKKNFLFFQENRAPDFLLPFYLILCIFRLLLLLLVHLVHPVVEVAVLLVVEAVHLVEEEAHGKSFYITMAYK